MTLSDDLPDDQTLYQIDGVDLVVPRAMVTPPLAEVLSTGRYEHLEARAMSKSLRREDRVLEIGAGVGFLAILAARIVGQGAVTAVEANPDLVPVLHGNLTRNGVGGARVVHGAVSPPGSPETIAFFARRAFWAGSTDERGKGGETKIDVPAWTLADLLDVSEATFLVMDIEGAEEHLFDAPLPEHLRRIIVELHPNRYGSAGVARVFQGALGSGFAYAPDGSRGKVVVFERVDP
ncbi:MAG: FkbM family methyltransferase [Pseudomonadota bacterium]